VNRHPDDLHAFALGDLTGAAEAETARHVAGCAACRREVRRLRAEHAATVEALPPIAPGPAARDRALAAARAVMAAATTTTSAVPAGAVPAGAVPAGAVPAGAVPAGAVPARSVTPGAVRGRWPRLPTWTAWALAWVVAVAAVGVSWERHAAWRDSEADRALVAGWLTRQDVTSWPLPAAPGDRSPGTVMVADDGVVLVVMRARAPAGAAYRTWGVGPEGVTALGDVPRTVLRATAGGFSEVVVSLEPRGSSTGPTAPLGTAPLPLAPRQP
jgi:anti-sigma factor RsiW